MINAARRMLSCHFTARRLQRYLDADPAAPLTGPEIRRLETHLADCERCSRAVAEFRTVHWALWELSVRIGPDDATVARLHRLVDDLVDGHAR